MLQVIRDKAQGWIAWAIVILITIPFALWGIQSYLGIGSEPLAAKVNGVEITERNLDSQFQRFRLQLREQLGAAYRPELFDDTRLRKEVLNRMIDEEVLRQASEKMGLRAGKPLVQAAILGMPAFQKDGRFDQETYERAVRLQGFSAAGFEERIRNVLVSEQLSQAVGAGTFVTRHELEQNARLQNQTRELTYFVVPASDFMLDGGLSDGEIQEYYTSHQEDYRAPEKVKLEYILLDATSAGATVEVNEDALRGYYDTHLDQFGIPEERRASHILLTLPRDADQAAEDATLEQLKAIQGRLDQGETFAELARELSQDPGSAASGGDLGYFGNGIMDPAFEAAVFSLQEGQVSDPVRSTFGYHLIELTGIKPGSVKSFEEARDEVETGYRKSEGERRYFELAEELANLSYEEPNSLDMPAETLGLTIQQSDWLTRDAPANNDLSNPKVLNAAFSEDVLKEQHNSDLIELDGTRSIVVRVIDHRESTIQPLDEVRDRVVETLQNQKAEQQAQAEAQKRVDEIVAGTPLLQAAGNYPVTGPTTVTRNDRSLPPALSSALFRAAKPAENESTPGTVRLAQGDQAVFNLSKVTEGSLDENKDMNQENNIRRLMSRSYYDRVLADLKTRADIEILLKQGKE
ncbi:MAG: SurA N-terminal domain-containing protein [Candidatus Thiodiazotropha sp.]